MQLSRIPAVRLAKDGHAVSHRSMVVWLLGLIVCIQVVHHFVVTFALQHDQAAGSSCAGSIGDFSPEQCAELQLFRSWQEASSSVHLFGEPEEDVAQLLVRDEDDTNNASEILHGIEPQANDGDPITPEVTTGASPIFQVISEKRVEWGNITPWAQGLIDLQASLEAKMESRRQARLEHHSSSHRRELPVVEHTSDATEPSNLKAWAQDLLTMQSDLELRMSHLHHMHARVSREPPAVEEHSLLERIQDFGRELCADPKRRARPSCAHFLSSSSESVALNETKPAISTGSSADHVAELNARLRNQHMSHDAWEEHFTDKMHTFVQELCKDPARWSYPACARLRASGSNTDAATEASSSSEKTSASGSLRGALVETSPGELHWRTVTAWKDKRNQASLGPQVVRGQDLLDAHWSGALPKVACITLIPCGRMVEHWMKHFIENFHSQSYEGARQLVLVYHHQDVKAKALVQRYADGVFIKGVMARDTDYPSVTSFRFGAFSADADIIARWDFHAWHDTHQLSLQVRALASTGRPACLLDRWSIYHSANSTSQEAKLDIESGGSNWDAAIVGEASWMNEHWYPQLDEERQVLETAMSKQIVRLDAPELVTIDEALQSLSLASRCHFEQPDEVVLSEM